MRAKLEGCIEYESEVCIWNHTTGPITEESEGPGPETHQARYFADIELGSESTISFHHFIARGQSPLFMVFIVV